MKKIFSAFVLLTLCGIFDFCSAYDYDSDPDYVYIGAGNGGAWYFQKSSLDVQEYNPPHYQIAGTFVHYSQSTSRIYIEKRYNWYTKETFTKNSYGYWTKDDFSARNMISAQGKHFANILFYSAYGMNFYN